MDKYIKIIHPHGYICVVYVQKENQGKITRELFEIYTPATTFIDDDPVLSNNISCLWIQKSKQLLTQKYIFGLSNVDVYTGKTNICEYCENYYHNPTTYDSIEKFLCVYNPIECACSPALCCIATLMLGVPFHLHSYSVLDSSTCSSVIP